MPTQKLAPLRIKICHVAAFAFAAGSIIGASSTAMAQGGGNANSIGLSIQDSAGAAAAAQNSSAMGNSSGSPAGGSYGQSSGPPGMSTGASTGLESYGDSSGGGAAYSSEMMGAEMSASGMYSGATPGGYGAPAGPGGRPGQPGMQGMMMSAGGAYLSSLAEFFNRPLSPDAMKFQPTLVEQAALAFHYGDQRKAMALFQAHMVAERESAGEGLEAIRYNALARRPTWAIRIGVSLHARVAEALIDDPEPIREDDVAPEANNRGPGAGLAAGGGAARGRGGRAARGSAAGSAGMEMGEMGMPGASGAAGASSGLMAGAGAAALGMPGGVAGEMGSEEMMGSDGMMGSGGMMGIGGMMNGAGGQQPKMAPAVNPAIAAAASAQQTLDSHLGMITELVKTQLTTRFNSGKFGAVLPDLAAKGPALAEKAAQTGASIPTSSSGGMLMWVPGVDFVGTGDANSMITKCRENEIDVLLHFDVIVKETRAEPQYDARCRVVNCASGENISVSKAINKRDVLLAARKRSNAAVIAELMQPVFDGLDAKVVAVAMPPLQPQHAIARIDILLAKPNVAHPDHLAELAMFHHKRLIDDEQLEQVMYFAAGENGLKLVFGSPEERAELAMTLVERQLGQ